MIMAGTLCDLGDRAAGGFPLPLPGGQQLSGKQKRNKERKSELFQGFSFVKESFRKFQLSQ